MMHELLSIRDARVYLAGQACSLFGDSALLLVLGIWVKELTGSSGRAGLAFFCFAVGTLLGPLTAVIVDRVRRRRLLIAGNVLSIVCVLPLLLVHGAGDVWIIYLVAFLNGVSYAILAAGQSALLATMLPDDLLAEANGVLQTVREGLRLVAPLAGAGLFAAFGGSVLVVLDASTFALAALSLAALRFRDPPPQREARAGESRLDELVAGARHVAGVRALRRMAIALGAALLAIGLCESVLFEVVQHGLHRRPAYLGVVLAVQGVGAIAGGVTAARLARRLGETALVAAGMTIFAAGCGLMAVGGGIGSEVAILAGVVLFGCGLPWMVVGEITLLQRRTPAHLQGRAFSAIELVTGLPQTLSIAAGALLVGVVDYRWLLLVIAVVVAGAGAWLVTERTPRLAGSAARQP
jgi:MFS family permease